MIWRQTAAILVDAYRELNAKKLFWITMILSGFVVLAFAMTGINDKGVTFLKWTLPTGYFTSENITPENFYKLIFVSFGIQIWLTWIAMILALISTAGIFPDLIAGGSIDLVLSKPISRTRLFLTKYLSGLLFVILQVAVFCAASFLVIGLRGGAWEFGIFLAVPIVALFFSYLFGLMALLGIITRSTIAALLITILVWFLIFLLHNAETTLLTFKTQAEMEIERSQLVIAETQSKIDEFRKELADLRVELNVPEPAPAPETNATAQPDETQDAEPTNDTPSTPAEPESIRRLERRIDVGESYIRKIQDDLKGSQSTDKALAPWHRMILAAKTALPKTAETTALLQRWLVDAAHLQEVSLDAARKNQDVDEDAKTIFADNDTDKKTPLATRVTQQEVQVALVDKINARSVGWVIGTSLAFEAAMVAIAAFIFRRRDF